MDGFYGTLGSLLPLALLVLVIVWIVYASRRRAQRRAQENPGAASHLKGVAGWLAWFVFAISVVGPAMLVTKTASGLTEAERANPALLELANWSNYRIATLVGALCYTLWCWFVAYRLCTRFRRSSVIHTRILLVLGPVLLLGADAFSAYVLFGITAFDESIIGLAANVAPATVWLLYFWLSKRVKNTYPSDLVAETMASATPSSPVLESVPIKTPPELQPAVSPHPRADSGLEAKLGELRRLFERGLVSATDYETKKADLLSRL